MLRYTVFLLSWLVASVAWAAPKTYPIGIESTPPGAEISIDGKIIGYTPYKGKVAAGTHDLLLKVASYDDFTTKLIIDKTSYKKTFSYTLIKAIVLPTLDVQAGDTTAESAQVFVDGAPSGTIPMSTKLPIGRHFVEVKKEGFVEYSEWVDLKEGGTSTLSVKLDAKKIEATLTMEGTSEAQVYVDGVLKGNIPVMVDKIEPGRHLVQVKKEGFQEFSQWVEFGSGAQEKLTAELTAIVQAAKAGSMRVFTDQDPAQVFLDGFPIGETPLTYESVSEGEHFIQIKKENYFTFEQRFVVKVGERQLVNATLTPAGPKAGSVRVISPVVESSVFIDGVFIGKVPVLKEDLSIGNHIIVVKHPGYADWTKNIEINGKDSLEFTAELVASGSIRLLSSLAGAEVFFDGERQQELSLEEGKPLVFNDVPVGAHKIMIRLKGYVDGVADITVSAGESVTADIKLVKVAERLSPEDRRKRIATYSSRALQTGDYAADIMVGIPYFLEVTAMTGALENLDVGISLKIAGAINELFIRGKYTLVNTPVFGVGAEALIGGGIGPSVGDDDKVKFTSNSVGGYVGGVASLFLKDIAAVSTRVGFQLYTDAGPTLDIFKEFDPKTTRDKGARLMTGLVVQLLQKEKLSYNFLLEGNPAGIGSGTNEVDKHKRRLMYEFIGFNDPLLYVRLGVTLKF